MWCKKDSDTLSDMNTTIAKTTSKKQVTPLSEWANYADGTDGMRTGGDTNATKESLVMLANSTVWCDFANEMTITLIFNRPSKPNNVVNKHIPFFRYSPQNPLSPYQTSSWLTTGIVLQSNHRKSPNPRSSIFAKSTMEITVIMRANCKFRKLYPYHVYIEIYLTVL